MKQTTQIDIKPHRQVMLSFDIEEFDMPIEYGKIVPMEEQLRISQEGTKVVLDILQSRDVKATFFSTVVFAEHSNDLVQRLLTEQHELASHSYFHSEFREEHLLQSKIRLESIADQQIVGFRMPRMMPVNLASLQDAGYLYDASLNPTWLPGRYNNFFEPRRLFSFDQLSRLPASVVPLVRFPLFWLSFHHLPPSLYNMLCRITIRADGYLCLYFHPWEFIDISDAAFGLPNYLTKNSGAKMISRFNNLIDYLKRQDCRFTTIKNFLKINPDNN